MTILKHPVSQSNLIKGKIMDSKLTGTVTLSQVHDKERARFAINTLVELMDIDLESPIVKAKKLLKPDKKENNTFLQNNENDIRAFTKILPPSHRMNELEILQAIYKQAKKEKDTLLIFNIKQRIKINKEQNKLIKKLAKLQHLMSNNPLTNLISKEHHELLKIQFKIMESYLAILVAKERLLYKEAKNSDNK